MRPTLYTGIHFLAAARALGTVMLSVNTLERRRSDFEVGRWMLDSGAFTRVTTGRGHMPTEDYAEQVKRWSEVGQMEAAVSQDFMCEPFVLERTGKTVAQHQTLSMERYLHLRELVGDAAYVMPVIQGYDPSEYARHVEAYGDDLAHGAWAGVGSVCKRNSNPNAISAVLTAILSIRPDLRLHGFGVKSTALRRGDIMERFYSIDSAAWSYAARKQGRNPNSIEECVEWTARVNAIPFMPSQSALGM